MRAQEFIKENASVGGTSSGSVATVAMPLGAMASRNPDSFFSGKYTTDPFPNTPKSMRKKTRKTNVK
jgi:hypothetical protein